MLFTALLVAFVAVTNSAPSDVCPYGTPMENWYCGRGGQRCPSYHFCKIAPDDSYAVCCPSHCQFGSALMNSDGTQVSCGLGGVRCPDISYTCNVAPNDAWAVCCPFII